MSKDTTQTRREVIKAACALALSAGAGPVFAASAPNQITLVFDVIPGQIQGVPER